ncbi:MAG: histidine phosphatase family protein [Sulfurimicrobium sp.]|nr:histidine phosphatase family protein [Sulfurimicrobium sp.]
MAETLIDLLRHGEPEGGVKFRGHSDDPLSADGWAQMRAATATAAGWEVIVASPLRRCADFAAELAANHGLPVETEGRLKEIGFGAWEGLTAEQVAASEPQALERFWRDPARHTPPGGESLDAFGQRVAAGWNDLLQRHAGKKILLVCHGGVIRLILAQVLEMPRTHLFRLNVPFASTSRIRVWGEPAQPELMFMNGKME